MKLPILDHKNFQILFSSAIKEWKELQDINQLHPSDPVYTILEMQSMLIDMLNYYMESITDAHYMKYKQLLYDEALPYLLNEDCKNDLVEDKTIFHFKTAQLMTYGSTHRFLIQSHDKWIALENKERFNIHPNTLTNIYYKDSLRFEEISDVLKRVDGTFKLPGDSEHATLYLQFKEPFILHHKIYLYVVLDDTKRNPVGLQTIKQGEWEFLSYGKNGWETLLVNDETNGFLHSGSLSFEVTTPMEKLEQFQKEGYWIKLQIKEEIYDLYPTFHMISLNTIPLYAHQTLAKSFVFQGSQRLEIEERSSDFTHIFMFQKEEQFWKKISYKVKELPSATAFELENQQDDKLYRITLWRDELALHMDRVLTGISSQSIHIPNFDKLQLSFLNNEQRLYDCFCVQPYNEGNTDYGCYITKEGIQLGNGRDFLLPEACEEGLFPLHFVKHEELTPLQTGNLKLNTINVCGQYLMLLKTIKKEKQRFIGLYQAKDIEATILAMDSLALEEVYVVSKAVVNRTDEKGWKVFVSGYEHRPLNELLLQHISSCIKKQLPIATSIELFPIYKKILHIALYGFFYFMNEEVKLSLEAQLKDLFKNYFKEKKSVYSQDIRMCISTNKDIIQIHKIVITSDDVECESIVFGYDIRYTHFDISLYAQE